MLRPHNTLVLATSGILSFAAPAALADSEPALETVVVTGKLSTFGAT